MKYEDKLGNELSEGDYIYYSELPYSDYADSLCRVANIGGELGSYCLVVNVFGEYIRHPRDEHPSLFKHHTIRENRLTDSLKVFPQGDLIEFMNANFPLMQINPIKRKSL